MHRTASTIDNYLTQNVNNAEVEKSALKLALKMQRGFIQELKCNNIFFNPKKVKRGTEEQKGDRTIRKQMARW